MRAGHHRRRVRARGRPRRDGEDQRRRARGPSRPYLPRSRACACSSSSTSRVPTACSTTARSTRRAAHGCRGARSAPVEADMVMGVPDSGIPAAVGYAQERDPVRRGAREEPLRGPHVHLAHAVHPPAGHPAQAQPLRHAIEGKRLVVVDDSIVRGNTSRKLVELLREGGATEVHMRITSPPVRWPCFYGIDTDTQEQLIAAIHASRRSASSSAPTRWRTCASRTWSRRPDAPPRTTAWRASTATTPSRFPSRCARASCAWRAAGRIRSEGAP